MSLILGIETSCDDTGVALYDNDRGLLANILYSQLSLHSPYGGVVPELASRDHLRHIIDLIDECCKQAGIIDKSAIDAIAYTQGPGLGGALLVGSTIANSLAFSLNRPVIPIHHLEGHILSPLLDNKQLKLPMLALLVSGGHSQIIQANRLGDYEILGDSLDDAAGECFDKGAKMLGLGYPGGKYISDLAQQGVPQKFILPRPLTARVSDMRNNGYNMSFSGLKTALNNLIHKLGGLSQLTKQDKCDIAFALEDAITDVLVYKLKLAITHISINTIVVCGGVSANTTLRRKLNALIAATNAALNSNESSKRQIYYPSLNFCTDNGAMIALAGSLRYHHNNNHACNQNYTCAVKPRWALNALS